MLVLPQLRDNDRGEQGTKILPTKTYALGRMVKSIIMLSAFIIKYFPKIIVKGQAIRHFIVLQLNGWTNRISTLKFM